MISAEFAYFINLAESLISDYGSRLDKLGNVLLSVVGGRKISETFL